MLWSGPPSTIPDSQSSQQASEPTQGSYGNASSQGTSQSGSVFYPSSSDITSQFPEVILSQTQHLLTATTTHEPSSHSQSSPVTGLDISSSNSRSWPRRISAVPRVINSLVRSSTQSLNSTSGPTNSQSTLLTNSPRPEASYNQAVIPHLQFSQPRFLGSDSCLPCNTIVHVEVQETPQSCISVQNTHSTTQPYSQLSVLGSESAQLSTYKGILGVLIMVVR